MKVMFFILFFLTDHFYATNLPDKSIYEYHQKTGKKNQDAGHL